MADFTTSFDLTENPISEGGIWRNGAAIGVDWFNCRTASGRVFGTETIAAPNYADSTAILTGTWQNNQTVQATVSVTDNTGRSFQEVEIRLRSAMNSHSCTGYEVLFSVNPADPYCQIVRWNGAFGDFTLLDAHTISVVGNGDTIKATIIGTTITAFLNGSSLFSVTDSTYSSGNPGIGFYLQFNSSPDAVASSYGFTDFTVVGDTGGLVPNPGAITRGAPIF